MERLRKELSEEQRQVHVRVLAEGFMPQEPLTLGRAPSRPQDHVGHLAHTLGVRDVWRGVLERPGQAEALAEAMRVTHLGLAEEGDGVQSLEVDPVGPPQFVQPVPRRLVAPKTELSSQVRSVRPSFSPWASPL